MQTPKFSNYELGGGAKTHESVYEFVTSCDYNFPFSLRYADGWQHTRGLEKHVSSKPETTDPQAAACEDYDDIEQAVMETGRGRWFLAEYARRNRSADTEILLEAIGRLEHTIPAEAKPAGEDPGLRVAIVEMAEEIADTKREIALIGSETPQGTDIAGATAELDAVVQATEGAASDILEAAEAVQEMAWTLREEKVADAYCDALDMRATEIYMACSFQDITGQRTKKVVRLLQNLESRISTLARLWNGNVSGDISEPVAPSGCADELLLNGPAREGEGISQDYVDQMMNDVENALPDMSPETLNEEAIEALAEVAAIHAPKPKTDPGLETDQTANQTEAEDRPIASGLEELSQKDMDALFA